MVNKYEKVLKIVNYYCVRTHQVNYHQHHHVIQNQKKKKTTEKRTKMKMTTEIYQNMTLAVGVMKAVKRRKKVNLVIHPRLKVAAKIVEHAIQTSNICLHFNYAYLFKLRIFFFRSSSPSRSRSSSRSGSRSR